MVLSRLEVKLYLFLSKTIWGDLGDIAGKKYVASGQNDMSIQAVF